MDSLALDNLVDIFRGMPLKDISNALNTNTKLRSIYLKREFWRRLIKRTFNGEGNTKEEYKCYGEYLHLIKGDLIELKKIFLSNELSCYKQHKPVLYFVLNHRYDEVNTIYAARSVSGFLLKFSSEYPKCFLKYLRHEVPHYVDIWNYQRVIKELNSEYSSGYYTFNKIV